MGHDEEQVALAMDSMPVRGNDHVPVLEHSACVGIGLDVDDSHAGIVHVDVHSQSSQGDDRSLLLRQLHRLLLELELLLVGDPRLDERALLDQVRAVRPEEREGGLQQRGLLHQHVDVVDAAAVFAGLASGHLHQAREGVCLVRNLEELVALLRQPDRDRSGEDDCARGHKPHRRQQACQHQSSPRVRPPSTTTVVPVT